MTGRRLVVMLWLLFSHTANGTRCAPLWVQIASQSLSVLLLISYCALCLPLAAFVLRLCCCRCVAVVITSSSRFTAAAVKRTLAATWNKWDEQLFVCLFELSRSVFLVQSVWLRLSCKKLSLSLKMRVALVRAALRLFFVKLHCCCDCGSISCSVIVHKRQVLFQLFATRLLRHDAARRDARVSFGFGRTRRSWINNNNKLWEIWTKCN